MNFQVNDYVKVEKIGAVDDPEFRTPDWDEFTPGAINDDMSLPVEYTCTGVVAQPPEEGKCFFIWRDTRNGVEVPGYLQTSRIAKVTSVNEVEVLVETQNSKYRVTKIPPPERTESGESEWKAS